MARMIGTVLPTRESLAATDAYARKLSREQAAVAAKELAGLERRTVGGEVRYYRGNRYAVVSRSLKALWFEVRDDGDYPIK